MSKGNKLYGAAAFTHRLKEFGGGESMQAGLNRLATESKRIGFLQGINYALQNILGQILGKKDQL